MRDETERLIINTTGGITYNDLHIPQDALDMIMDASNTLIKNQRNDKIDKLIGDDDGE